MEFDGNNLHVYKQSSVIPYRIKEGETSVLLITARSGKNWIVPKGLIEPDMSPQESAAMEAFEEAGIRGKVLPELIGEYRYNKWGGVCEVLVYLMEVSREFDDWPESFRNRKWVPLPEAISLVKPELKDFFVNFASHLERANG